MSYILDALKKAERERERKLVKVPTIETVHEFPQRERTSVRSIGIVAAVVLCLVVAIFFLIPRTGSEKQVLETSVPTTEVSTQNLERDALLPVETPVFMPTPMQAGSTAPKGEIFSKPEVPEIIAMEPENSVRVENVPSSPVVSSVQQQINMAQLQYSPSSPARPKAPVAVSAAPFRDVVTAMALSVHLYSDNKDERMVFINGRKYQEGDSVTADCVVENITPEGVVLQRGDERVTLRPGAPPVFH